MRPSLLNGRSETLFKRSVPWAIAFACGIGATHADAQSYLLAGVSNSIWAVPAISCGVTTGKTIAPVAGVQQNCAHDYTTTTGATSRISLTGAAQTGYDFVQMRSTGDWANLGAPDFTGGSWGQTAYSESLSTGQSHIEGALYNNTDLPHVYSMASTMRMSGTMYFRDAGTYSELIVFPWSGRVTSALRIDLNGLGGGCDLAALSYQSPLVANVPPNGFHFDLTCTGGAQATIPAHSYAPLTWGLSAIDTASTNPANLRGGDFGVDIDFLHTAGISSIEFRVDGVPVDPSSVDFRSDAGVKFTSTGIVPVPEPGTCALWLAGLAGLGFAARRRKA